MAVIAIQLNQRCTVMILYSLMWFCIHNAEANNSVVIQYCPYFQNRAPQPQPSLENCTWYKENACCLNEELSIVFSNLLPMVGANGECLKVLNYLYCYICSPDQNTFFGRDMLTVCEESCNLVYSKCKDALLKGVHLGELYTNGTDFCAARKFLTGKAKVGECFDFTELFSKSFAKALRCYAAVLASCLFVYAQLVI